MTLLSLSLIPAEMIQDIREPLPNILQAERVLLLLRSQTSDRSDEPSGPFQPLRRRLPLPTARLTHTYHPADITIAIGSVRMTCMHLLYM